MENSTAVTFSSGRVWLDDANGIVRVEFAPGTHQTIQIAREVIAGINSITSGARRPALVDLTRVKAADRDARSYYGSPEATASWSAAALLVDSPLSTTIANIWMAVFSTIHGKRANPSKIFSDEAAAVEWLKGFRS
ncbi:hypothetical protein WMF26_38000 [Sorangium sp. So ce185]|uniref:DUF7793 family protein n=1 Tax=Sorangium sp. So ce185 TaxID=3133287 RepID=UPI003F640743